MLKRSILPVALSAIALSSPISYAEKLTDSQRELFNERLDIIMNKSQETLASRQATAYKAFKGGAASNSAAFTLYLKCVEKVNFTDAGKKSSEFRDWKRKNKEKHAEPGFRLALRHQLNWLLLTIYSTRSSSGGTNAMAAKAQEAMQQILDSGKQLKDHHPILKGSVLGSIYARAYGFNNFDVNGWPTQPLNFHEVFSKAIFPTLKENGNAAALRRAWTKRITMEETAIEIWAKKNDSKSIGLKKNITSPELEHFLSEERPKLLWQMEKDIYEAGNESEASSKMLRHIASNYTHNDAIKWAEELKGLLSPQKEVNVEANEEQK